MFPPFIQLVIISLLHIITTILNTLFWYNFIATKLIFFIDFRDFLKISNVIESETKRTIKQERMRKRKREKEREREREIKRERKRKRDRVE